MRRSIRNFNIPPPSGIPRAFDCTSFPGRGEFERYVGRVGNLNQIYLLFWRNTPVSFSGFCRVWWIYKIEFCLCYWITLSKGSLKEVWRCHYGISPSEKCEQCLIEDEICLWGSGSSALIGGTFERLFCPERKEFEQANLQKFKCPGGCPGGILNFRIDRRIICSIVNEYFFKIFF